MAIIKEVSAGTTTGSGSYHKINKKLLLSLFASVFLVATVTADKNSSGIPTSHSSSIIKSSCSNTFFPELCFSAISESPLLSSKVTNKKDVIVASLNQTISAVKHNFILIQRLTKKKDLTKRQNSCLYVCLELLNETLDELHGAKVDLNDYPNKKSQQEYADDLNTLLSSAISNQATCLEAFSYSEADKKLREAFLEPEIHVEKMCRNALAMIKNMTETDMAVEAMTTKGRKLEQKGNDDVSGSGWPKWVSAKDRKLLESRTTVKPNVVVALDGSGDFRTVSAAVEAAPSSGEERYVIKIKAGIYREYVEVRKPNIMFLGDRRGKTIITGNRSMGGGINTFRTATVAVVGKGFLARDITVKNTAGPHNHQAVALRVGADKSAFYRCRFMAYQDTLYVHTNRQFFTKCYITGTIDFIFGYGSALFQDCDIYPRRPNPSQQNMVTAHARIDPNEDTGIVIQNSRIDASSDLKPVLSNFSTYFGRPWEPYSRTVVMQSRISEVIHPAGWHRWDKNNSSRDSLVEYREYDNFGLGADTTNRVDWKGFKVITNRTEAKQYTAGEFISGGRWLHLTGFPHYLGL